MKTISILLTALLIGCASIPTQTEPDIVGTWKNYEEVSSDSRLVIAKDLTFRRYKGKSVTSSGIMRPTRNVYVMDFLNGSKDIIEAYVADDSYGEIPEGSLNTSVILEDENGRTVGNGAPECYYRINE